MIYPVTLYCQCIGNTANIDMIHTETTTNKLVLSSIASQTTNEPSNQTDQQTDRQNTVTCRGWVPMKDWPTDWQTERLIVLMRGNDWQTDRLTVPTRGTVWQWRTDWQTDRLTVPMRGNDCRTYKLTVPMRRISASEYLGWIKWQILQISRLSCEVWRSPLQDRLFRIASTGARLHFYISVVKKKG